MVDKRNIFIIFVNQTIRMNNQEKDFFGTRLKLARKMAGLSLQELSDFLGNIVTKQALNKYEQGIMNPTSAILNSLSKALNVSPDYFLKKMPIELGEITFRKNSNFSKKEEDSLIEEVRDYVERFLEMEAILGIESHFENPLIDYVINNNNDVEQAAEYLREKWHLGRDALSNVIETLELQGVKVLLLTKSDRVDGLSLQTSSGIPVVVVNIFNKPSERIRFTILHELAHLLLQFGELIRPDKKEIERLCHYFSNCFLLPSGILHQIIGGPYRTYISINELIMIKENYGISIRAILIRLKWLNIITDNYYQRWMIYLGKTYGVKKEPGKYEFSEQQRLLEHYVNRALSEGLISLSKAAYLLHVDLYQLRKKLNDAD